DEDRLVAQERAGETIEEVSQTGAPYHVRLLDHDPTAYDRFYNGIANGALWFLHHYLWGLAAEPDLGPDFSRAWTDGYERVNRSFPDALLDEPDRDPAPPACVH